MIVVAVILLALVALAIVPGLVALAINLAGALALVAAALTAVGVMASNGSLALVAQVTAGLYALWLVFIFARAQDKLLFAKLAWTRLGSNVGQKARNLLLFTAISFVTLGLVPLMWIVSALKETHRRHRQAQPV